MHGHLLRVSQFRPLFEARRPCLEFLDKLFHDSMHLRRSQIVDHREMKPIETGAVRDVVADAAEPKLVLHVEDRLRQVFRVLPAGPQHVERDALRRFRADAGQAFELGDQAGERLG